MTVGHEKVREQLQEELPPVALLQGPESVGKWTLASETLAHHGITGPYVRAHQRLRVDDAREVLDFLSTRGFQGRSKAVLVRVDGATEEALNVLLKVLEEPPDRSHFLLVAAAPPMLTVASRAQIFQLGYLTEQEVATVLVATTNLPMDRAEVVAQRAGGQIRRAYEAHSIEESKGPVLSVLKAAAEGNEELFCTTVSGRRLVQRDGRKVKEDVFGSSQLSLLLSWAREALTGRWRMWSPAESYGLQRDHRVPNRVLKVIAGGVRPKVAVRVALWPVVWERSLRAGTV
jgi:hypothetical protein